MTGIKFRSVVTSVGEERERDQRKITEGLELHTEYISEAALQSTRVGHYVHLYTFIIRLKCFLLKIQSKHSITYFKS